MNNLKKHTFLILALLWTLVIFAFSLQSGDESIVSSNIVLDLLAMILPILKDPDYLSITVLVIRKVAHFTEYFILAYFYTKASTETKQDKLLLLGYLIPIFDEGIQLFSPGRASSPVDMLIDMSGYLCGLIFFGSFMRLFRVIKKNWTGKE
ncbi:MAG: VanZ family protein [Erysipelotrichaceae bacterium]|nr:VanZ family protein [Erysipelotrichaceae bacterium]